MIGGEIDQIPVPEPEEHTFLVHMEVMSDLRDTLFSDLVDYTGKPDEESAKKIIESSTELAGHFEEALEFVLDDDSYTYLEKVLGVQALHTLEADKRVERINTIAGKDIVKPVKFQSLEDAYGNLDEFIEPELSEDDYEKWKEQELMQFAGKLGADLNTFIEYIDSQPLSKMRNAREIALKKANEIATIAAGVVIGGLILKKFNK